MKIAIETVLTHKRAPLLAVMRDDVDGHVIMRIAFDYCIFKTTGVGIDTILLYRVTDETNWIAGEVNQMDCTDSAIEIMHKVSKTDP